MATRLRHLVRSQQFKTEVIDQLFSTADTFRNHPHSDVLHGKTIVTLFYEQSTRTRLSFESAMLRLGGNVISTENAREFSSAAKGESLEDTIRVVAAYVDGIVLRHFESGSARKAAAVSPVPLINAGDGKGQHPTQALLDLYTIKDELGRLDHLKIACVGDLASGRTVRSLCYLLGKYKDIEITFISPENLRMGNDIKNYLKRHKVRFGEQTNLNRVLPQADIVYMTRIQKERISAADYQAARGQYVIDITNFKLLRPTARLMHPLPRIEEIELPIKLEQTDKRVAYFRQARNGLYVRMALLEHMLRP